MRNEENGMKILMINGCIRGAESRSWMLAEAFLGAMKMHAPQVLDFTQLNLAELNLKPLTGSFFEERQQLLEENNRRHPRFFYAHQFAQADRILIAAPFWDLSIPAVVKLYIENISLDGITFGCNDQGMYGMCKAKDMIFFTTRGGVYGNGSMEQGARYLKALCEMFGIPKFRCICAEGVDQLPDQADEIMRRALDEAREAGLHYWEGV